MMRNLVKSVGCGRKVVESFTNMKARIKMSKKQPIYLQCEDLYCKANLKLHRKRKIPGIFRKKKKKLRGKNFEGQGEGSG